MEKKVTRTRERGGVKKEAPAKKPPLFGEGSEIGQLIKTAKARMGEHTVSTGISSAGCTYIETGIFLLDLALLGGLQESRVNQLYGWEASSKTTTAMRSVAAAQRKHKDKVVSFIDAEGTFDPVWAAKHGVDCTRLVYFQPETGEECVDVLDASIRAKETCAIILDSIPAIVPQKIIENAAEDMTVGKRAQLLGTACSKMIAALQAERRRDHEPAIILINQWRTKIGVMHGDPRRLPGGDQLKFLSSVMVEMKRGKTEMGKDAFENDTPVLNTHAFDVDKVKGAASILQGEFRMIRCNNYEAKEGYTLPSGAIDDYRTVATYARRMGFITGGGTSWKIDAIDKRFGKLEEILRYLVENPEEFIILKRKMIALKRAENNLPAIPSDGYLLGWVK